MRSEPTRLAEILLDFAGISARRDEIFPYERSIPVRRDICKLILARRRDGKFICTRDKNHLG